MFYWPHLAAGTHLCESLISHRCHLLGRNPVVIRSPLERYKARVRGVNSACSAQAPASGQLAGWAGGSTPPSASGQGGLEERRSPWTLSSLTLDLTRWPLEERPGFCVTVEQLRTASHDLVSVSLETGFAISSPHSKCILFLVLWRNVAEDVTIGIYLLTDQSQDSGSDLTNDSHPAASSRPQLSLVLCPDQWLLKIISHVGRSLSIFCEPFLRYQPVQKEDNIQMAKVSSAKASELTRILHRHGRCLLGYGACRRGRWLLSLRNSGRGILKGILSSHLGQDSLSHSCSCSYLPRTAILSSTFL